MVPQGVKVDATSMPNKGERIDVGLGAGVLILHFVLEICEHASKSYETSTCRSVAKHVVESTHQRGLKGFWGDFGIPGDPVVQCFRIF